MESFCLIALAADAGFIYLAAAMAPWDDAKDVLSLLRFPRWQELAKAFAMGGILLFTSWAFSRWGGTVYPRPNNLIWGLIVGPFYEEVARAATIYTFRRFFRRSGGLVSAIAVSTAIFVLRHFGWGPLLSPLYAVFLTFWAMACGAIYARTRSLPFTSAFHVAFNVTACFFIVR